VCSCVEVDSVRVIVDGVCVWKWAVCVCVEVGSVCVCGSG